MKIAGLLARISVASPGENRAATHPEYHLQRSLGRFAMPNLFDGERPAALTLLLWKGKRG
ncbi:hypothetical protein OSCI_270002 [Kamptonema sp. PCC 6506]|nr:hypothetical protein OSCI_270002 [Kamptonema sp. PCC 6506]